MGNEDSARGNQKWGPKEKRLRTTGLRLLDRHIFEQIVQVFFRGIYRSLNFERRLNEGHTVFLERKIMKALTTEQERQFMAQSEADLC